jgi:hypothetical protein
MKITIVTYKVKKESVEQNIGYINKVFEDLMNNSPEAIQYAASIADDGQTFTHIVCFTDEKPFMVGRDSFKEFQTQLKEIVEEAPKAVSYNNVANYKLF